MIKIHWSLSSCQTACWTFGPRQTYAFVSRCIHTSVYISQLKKNISFPLTGIKPKQQFPNRYVVSKFLIVLTAIRENAFQ